MKYPCMPKYLIPNEKDEFNYKLQSKDEVKKQMQEWKDKGVSPDMEIIYRYFDEYHKKPLTKSTDNRSETVKIILDTKPLPFAPLQRRRFNYLVGPRQRNGVLKLSCKRYPRREQNLAKAKEIIKELIIESLRAPRTMVNEMKNPYLRDKHEAQRRKAAKKARLEAEGTVVSQS